MFISPVHSFLMVIETLRRFKELSIMEPAAKKTCNPLSYLTDTEQLFYQEFINNTHGKMLRLEQERISYLYLKEQLDKI